MISPHTFPVRGRRWAPLTLLLQARIFRKYVTGRFTPSWEAATTCRFYWKWHWQNRPPLRRRNPAGTTKRQTGWSSKTWLTCCAENLTLTTVRTSTPVSSSWRTAYSRQQSRPSPEAEDRTTSLLEQPPTVPPWPTCGSQKTTWATSFARAHHPLQQGKGCFWRRKEQGSPQVMARKDWLTQHGERHTEALESDKGPEWWPAACPKSSPFEGRYPDLHRKESSLLACRQFPRGQPTWYLKGETSRHQNEDQGTTTETISNPQHDIWVLYPWAELRHQTAKKQESHREGWHFQWDDPPPRKSGLTETAGHLQSFLEYRDISNQLERGHNHPHPQEREGQAQQDQLPPNQPSKLPGQNHGAHGEQTSPAPPWKEWTSLSVTVWLQEE